MDFCLKHEDDTFSGLNVGQYHQGSSILEDLCQMALDFSKEVDKKVKSINPTAVSVIGNHYGTLVHMEGKQREAGILQRT